jgi:hypothetical protein
MSLIIKPPSWGHCTTNITGTPSTTGAGTAVTPGNSNADGTAVAALTNIGHDVECLVIGAYGFNLAGANTSTLLDILVDPAGGSTWATDPLINDLLVGQTNVMGTTSNGIVWYHFPIWLKSGHSIGLRARQAHSAADPGVVMVFAYGGNANPGSWWCGQTVESVGIIAASSQGTDHTPGNSGAFSTWTDFGSTLSKPCGALQFAVQATNDDTTQSAAAYHFEFGVGSTRIGPPIWRSTTTTEVGWSTPTGLIFCALPTGTQLQVRGTCSGTAEAIDVAAYAVM